MENVKKFDPRHPKTPEPMATKIGRGDYVKNMYPCAKLHYDPIKGFCPFLPICEVAYEMFSRLVFWGSSNSLHPRLLRRFWRSIRHETLFRTIMCLLGVLKTIFTVWPNFGQKAKLLVDFRRDFENFSSKRDFGASSVKKTPLTRPARSLEVGWWIDKLTSTSQNIKSVSTPEVD